MTASVWLIHLWRQALRVRPPAKQRAVHELMDLFIRVVVEGISR
ncbi:MAG: hypothetical protein ABWY46_01875 [Pseudomonas sp.]|jgi:hypothetical protein